MSLYDIPAVWFQQIYIKNGKTIKFMKFFNQKLLKELYLENNTPMFNTVLYCMFNMKYKSSDMISTITITLDWNDPNCRLFISSNKRNFYKGINDLIDRKVLFKLKPKVYIVSMDYICFMDENQKSIFKSSVYPKLLNERLTLKELNDTINDTTQ